MQYGFYAYPSEPKEVAETVAAAVPIINSGKAIEVKTWEELRIGGVFIIREILRAIKESQVFCADLTGLNRNVLFELGYAVAIDKRIWLSLDASYEKEKKEYEDFRLFTTVGYRPYENRHDLANKFLSDHPFTDLDNTLFNSAIKEQLEPTQPKCVYLKSIKNNDASVKLTQEVTESQVKLVIDDPTETISQPLSWYIEAISSSRAVLAHFAADAISGSRMFNAKLAFLCGLSMGLDKNLLMLSPENFQFPIDFRDTLAVYGNTEHCRNIASEWISDVRKKLDEESKEKMTFISKEASKQALRNLSFGDHEAEREEGNLSDYFIETAPYLQALNENQVLFIGRKGTGKTANVIQLSRAFSNDKRNFVCEVRPVDYELEGVVELLEEMISKAQRGFLIESLWKFLLYTELAYRIKKQLDNKRAPLTKEEDEFYSFCSSYDFIIKNSFSIRLETAIERLSPTRKGEISAEENRLLISEGLHEQFIKQLRFYLGHVLKNRNKVIFLVDNLDKAWKSEGDVDTTCEFLLGLINVMDRIRKDFVKSDSWRETINVSLVFFLRSDIFNRLLEFAREPDKLNPSRIIWDDSEALVRVIEERFNSCFESDMRSPETLWQQFITERIRGQSTKEYLANVTLPRPRDIIFLCNEALAVAVNRGHTKVEEDDFLKAEEQYSMHAYRSIISESALGGDKIEDILLELSEKSAIVEENDLNTIAQDHLREHKDFNLANHLFELTFLGFETAPEKFEFNYNEEAKRRIIRIAEKYAQKRGGERRFLINRPFWAYLSITA